MQPPLKVLQDAQINIYYSIKEPDFVALIDSQHSNHSSSMHPILCVLFLECNDNELRPVVLYTDGAQHSGGQRHAFAEIMCRHISRSHPK